MKYTAHGLTLCLIAHASFFAADPQASDTASNVSDQACHHP